MENSSKDGNTRTPYLPPEKSIAGQEATVRTGHGTTDWFQIGKQGCILILCLFNYMQSASCEMPGWMKHSWNQDCRDMERNINNLRYADDSTLMTESEELKSLLMKVKEA